jgi:biotin carboxyl carrier protein
VGERQNRALRRTYHSQVSPSEPMKSTRSEANRAIRQFRTGSRRRRRSEEIKPKGSLAPGARAKPETKAEPKPETKTAPSSSTKKKVLVAGVIILAVLAILAIGFGLGRWWGNSKKDQNRLVLYGNVDLRQVELAFNNSERIAEVLVQEGDKVKRGQILARLDTAGSNRRRRRRKPRWRRSRRWCKDCITAAARRKSRRPRPMSRRPKRTWSMPAAMEAA